jgi:ferrous iron transport protein A
MTLTQLRRGHPATVSSVDQSTPADPIARRLRVLGFVDGEDVRVIGAGPVGADPLLVQIGHTRFALRRSEAERIRIVTR